jgi:hypothetical protein
VEKGAENSSQSRLFRGFRIRAISKRQHFAKPD